MVIALSIPLFSALDLRPQLLNASHRFALLILALALTSAAGLSGCRSLGPKTLDRDQIDYGNSIGENWKDQMLANLVKIRYLDMPVFVDVGQIVSGYTLETQLDGSMSFFSSLGGGDSQSVGVVGRYTDRPTITYQPKTGEDYLRSLLAPVDPVAVLSLVAAGYSPELVFTWAVESINGVRNFSGLGRQVRAADPEYYEFVELLKSMQREGVVGFEIRKNPDQGGSVVFSVSCRTMTPEKATQCERLRQLVQLPLDVNEFRVVYSPFEQEGDVLAIQTRSIMQVLSTMSDFVEVPADKADRATEGFASTDLGQRPFTIRTSKSPPETAFASFRYHDDWYWIDHEDLVSKRVFTLMLFLTTLTNRNGNDNAPVLTIPTG